MTRYHVSRPGPDPPLWRGIALGMVFEAAVLVVTVTVAWVVLVALS